MRRSALTVVIGCLLAMLGTSQLTRTVHLALEPHVRCEHGQWTHASGHHHSSDAERPKDDPHGDPALRDGQASSAEHAHCDSVAVEQSPLPTVHSAVVGQLLTWELCDSSAERRASPRSIPLLLLAPKQSPPSV